uniref:Uncharacterized protein n=1 Tax=Brassica campestris TaxID=3711 RepID=M4F4K6_BRACM
MGKANRKLNDSFSDATKLRGKKNDCGVCVLMLWKTSSRSPEAVCLEVEITFKVVAEEW